MVDRDDPSKGSPASRHAAVGYDVDSGVSGNVVKYVLAVILPCEIEEVLFPWVQSVEVFLECCRWCSARLLARVVCWNCGGKFSR